LVRGLARRLLSIGQPLGFLNFQHLAMFSVSEPDPEPDPDPVGSGIISRIWIRIRISNFGSEAGKDPELDFCLQTEVLPNIKVY
jgi:hypothetical protein